MERRKFTREFKLEAVRLIKDRGASYVHASEDLGVDPSQLRDWVKKFAGRRLASHMTKAMTSGVIKPMTKLAAPLK